MEKSRQGGLRILFADDEAHLRDLMQMELPRLGHEVTVCPDGAAALAGAREGVVRRGPARPADARVDRDRGPGPDPPDQPRDAGHHPDRPRHGRHGRAGAAAGGVRLPDQAVQVGRARGDPQPGRRAARHGQQDDRARDPAQGRRGDAALDRRDAGDAAGPPPDRHDRPDRCHRS